MHMDEIRAADYIRRLLKLGVVFAGEADNNIGREGGAIERLMQAVDHLQEIIARVLAIHSPKNQV